MSRSWREVRGRHRRNVHRPGDRGRRRATRLSTRARRVPSDPVKGILNVFEVAAARARASRARELLGSRRDAGPRHHARAQRGADRQDRANGLPHDRGPPGHPAAARGRAHRRLRPRPAIPRALRAALAHLRGAASASAPTARCSKPLDEDGARATLDRGSASWASRRSAVCLLWSIVNPAHELRVGELLAEHLPGVPVTLSHELNPCLREYRRASSTAIDASLKPLMTDYIGKRRRSGCATPGFARPGADRDLGRGRARRAATSRPRRSTRSTPGPSMAPVAGRYFASCDAAAEMAIVADTGGTSYDVSLVRRGRIPWTRETWLGRPYFGHMTGSAVGRRPQRRRRRRQHRLGRRAAACCTSGPRAPGPSPARRATARAGPGPTVTDACLVLGYIDPDYFLGGASRLDVDAARAAIARAGRRRRSGSTSREAAAAIVRARDRAHGLGDRGDHDPPGHRPARRGARRRRRGGRAQRRRDRARGSAAPR